MAPKFSRPLISIGIILAVVLITGLTLASAERA